MDTTLTFAPKAVAAIPYVAEREPPRDNKVPVVKGFEGAATLPADKPFVAQVVNARLSGAEFPENPGEIAPSERTLRPYDIPMLPSEDKTTPSDANEATTVPIAEQGDQTASDMDVARGGETAMAATGDDAARSTADDDQK